MIFCSRCAAPTSQQVPPDDNRLRSVCISCGTVHYENPKMVLGTLPIWQDQVLLCRRAIEPRYGFWTLPAGFMELGESTAEGAVRETLEESGAEVRLQGLFAIFDVVVANQVHLFYLAEIDNPRLNPGPETLEARFFREEEIPWEELAFRSVSGALKLFFNDRRLGASGIHTQVLR